MRGRRGVQVKEGLDGIGEATGCDRIDMLAASNRHGYEAASSEQRKMCGDPRLIYA
jgi:hypothetical protein